MNLVECAVSDVALEVLGKNCPNLVSLNVSEERKKKLITDEVNADPDMLLDKKLGSGNSPVGHVGTYFLNLSKREKLHRQLKGFGFRSGKESRSE